MNNIETKNKWLKTGLLDATHDDNKEKLISLLDETCLYLAARKKETGNNSFFYGMILPIVVRIYNGLPPNKNMPPIPWIINDLNEYLFVNKLYPPTDSDGGYTPIENMEYEICRDYTNRVIKMEKYEKYEF